MARAASARLSDVDARLHRERTRGAQQLSACADLPDGTMVSLDGRAWVVVGGGLRAWTHGGYGDRRACPPERVAVLTPPSTLAAMRSGWRPRLHPTAREHRGS